MDSLRDQFLIEGRELVQTASADLLVLGNDPARLDSLDSAFRAIHTLKGSTGLFEIKPLGTALTAAEDLLGAMRARVVVSDAELANALLRCIDQAARWLDAFEVAGSLPTDAPGVAQRIAEDLRRRLPIGTAGQLSAPIASSDQPWIHTLLAGLDPALAEGALTAIRYVPKRDSFFTGNDPVAIFKAIPQLCHVSVGGREPWGPLDRFDPFACNIVLEGLSEAPHAEIRAALRLVADQVQIVETDPRRTAKTPETTVEAGRDVASRTLRVDADKIDILAGIAEELIVANNALAHLAAQARRGVSGDALVQGLLASQTGLDRMVGALHRAVMQVRLVPLSSLFRHFPRLVREIGATLGKDLDLALQGEAIEVDKSLVDGLFEPILHLIRNAADHGIESAAARREAGKPMRGSITLGASRVLDVVVIEVADDGKGIDPVVVRRTAKDRGVLPDEALAALSDSDTIDLLFMPGFSTASSVTDLSGRGVGLDAVRNAVARLGGRVALSSRPGIGTSFRLSLPASVVLTGTIIVACADESFGIPMEAVLETLRLPPERVVPIRNGRAFTLRDMVVPIFDLAALLGLPLTPRPGDLKLLVFRDGDAVAAVAVDEFSDRHSLLLRPMDGLLSGMPGIAGTALLGTGQVLIILDLPELVG